MDYYHIINKIYYIILGVQLGRVDLTQLKPSLIFGRIWINIFITQVELGLSFLNSCLIWIGLKSWFKQSEPNPNLI